MSNVDSSDAKAPRDPEQNDSTELRAEMARSLARGGMTGVQVISWEAADEVLTPKRRELIEALRNSKVESVRALAREVGRDKAQVSRDLGVLAEHGVIQYEKNGNAKQPRLTQQHIVVEPVV